MLPINAFKTKEKIRQSQSNGTSRSNTLRKFQQQTSQPPKPLIMRLREEKERQK